MSLLEEYNVRYSATKMFPGGELDQMKSMLDDPSVSAENKKNFLYALKNVEQISDEDIDKYAGQIGADADDIKDGGEAPMENLVHAKESIPKAQNDQRVGKEKADVKNAQSNLDSGGGYVTSDEIIAEGEKALKLFDVFHPRFQKAGGQDDAGQGGGKPDHGVVTTDSAQGKGGGNAPAGYSKSGVDPRSLREGMAEFKGIDFNAFRTDAQMLSETDGAVNDANEVLNQAWGGTNDWTGDAKSAAEERNNKLVTGGGDLSQALKTAPGDITNTIDTCVQKNVVNFASQVLDLYGDGTIAKLTPQQVDDFLKAKNDLPPAIKNLEDKIKEIEDKDLFDKIGDLLSNPLTAVVTIVNPVAAGLGYMLASSIDEDNIKEETEKYKNILNDANQKLKQFCDEYKTKANSIHQSAQEFVQGIQENYDSLIEALNKGMDPDPFAQKDEGKPGADQADHGGQSKVDTGTGGSGGASDVGTGGNSAGATGAASVPTGGSGAGGSDAGSGSGGAAAAPPSGGASGPSAGGSGGDSGGTTAPQGTGGSQDEPGNGEPGMNPVTGKPVEADPKTGEPYPIDPETGEPVKDGAEGHDAMTVQRGANTIGLAEPGPDGTMGISVDDGSGQPKELKLDFGDGQQGGPEGFGPGTGPDGAGTPAEGAPGDEVHKPGPDGKIHITEGDLEITAERPEGPDGPTTITIDDGSGEPTTYTLGEDTRAAGLGSTPGQDAAGDAMGAAGASTDPASAGSLFAGAADPAGGAGDAGAPAAGLGDADGTGAPGAGLGDAGGASASGAGLGDSGGDAAGGDGGIADEGGPTGGGEGGGAAGDASVTGDEPPLESGSLTGSIAGEPEIAGVGAAPGGGLAPGPPATGQGAEADGGAGGMPMMAGLGGAAGGEQDRGTNPYRVDGGLFEGSGGQRISGSLDEQPDQPVRYER